MSSANVDTRLRVAVLVDGPLLSRYGLDLLAWLEAEPSLSLAGVWYPASATALAPRLAARARCLLYRLEARLARLGRAGDPGQGVQQVAARPWQPSAGQPGAGGDSELPSFDLLLRAGAVPDEQAVAMAWQARYGVIGMDFSLSAPPDQGGVGFAESFAGAHQAGMVLYALGADLSEPWVIRRGWFQPHWSLGRTRAMLLAAATRMMKDAVLQCSHWHRHSAEVGGAAYGGQVSAAMRAGTIGVPLRRQIWPEGAQAAHGRGREKDLPPRLCARRIAPVPLSGLLAYMGRTLGRLGRKALDHRRGRGYLWQLGFVQANHPATADFAAVRPVGSPGRCFHADPVLVAGDGPEDNPVLFVEEWAPGRARGHISALEVEQEPAVEGQGLPRLALRHLGKVIETQHHLSFPFHFRWQGVHYLCPESANSGRITVWRAERFPTEWKAAAVLMDNVSAVDTMLFESAGRWWMLTNIDRTGTPLIAASRDFHSELHLFHADHPLSSEWTPHPMNPLRIDCHGGRNAGLFVADDGIFRFGQLQAFDCYGHGLAMYRITTLNTTHYAEELVRVVTPGMLKGVTGLHGLHSFCQVGDLAVVDLLHRGKLREVPAAGKAGKQEPGPAC